MPGRRAAWPQGVLKGRSEFWRDLPVAQKLPNGTANQYSPLGTSGTPMLGFEYGGRPSARAAARRAGRATSDGVPFVMRLCVLQ